MTTRIVCVGNELVCDDGVGIRVGRILRDLALPEGVEVVLASDVGLDLIDTILSATRLVLVDATRTGHPPGTLRVLSQESVRDFAQTPCCCHAVGLPELLRLAARLDARPRSVVLVGVEAAILDRFGTELSAAVRVALPDAVAEVLRQVGASPELIDFARTQAQLSAQWEPAAIEAYGG